MIYEWKAGFPSAGVKAEAAARQLERIRVFHKTLTTDLIVEDSKRPDAALNPFFEWNNTEAAHHWRISQASTLLRSLVVISDGGEVSPAPIRAYVRVGNIDETDPVDDPSDELPALRRKSVFERTDIAMADTDMRRRVLQNAWREVVSWRNRYNEYKELARICAVIDEEKEQIAS